MENKKLNKKLEDLKSKIKANSKDAHFAESLISDILSVKGQMMTPPLPIYDLGKELGKYEGETFYIAKHEKAVVYHVYNSFDLVVRPNLTSLYEALCECVDNKDTYNKLEGDEKEAYELHMSAMAYILSLPTFVFTDVDFFYEIATSIVKYLTKMSDELLNQPLQEETPKEDEEFKDAVLGVEEMKKNI